MSEAVKAWHFLPADRRLRYQDARVVVDGETMTMPGLMGPRLCERGMHASVKVTQALKYAPGAVLCRVEVSGDVEHGDDKIVGRHRKVLWSITAEKGIALIVEYAQWCAARAKQHAGAAAGAAGAAADYAAAYADYAADDAAGAAAYAAAGAAAAADAADYAAAYAAGAADYAAGAAAYAAYAAGAAAYAADYAAGAAVADVEAAGADWKLYWKIRDEARVKEREEQEQWWITKLTEMGCEI